MQLQQRKSKLHVFGLGDDQGSLGHEDGEALVSNRGGLQGGGSSEEGHIPELEDFRRGRGGLQVGGSREETDVYWVVQRPVTSLDEGHVDEMMMEPQVLQ